MAKLNNSDRIRVRYGICLNDFCENGKSKEKLEIPARKEFVCPMCGKPLRECPPPKKKGKGGKLVAIVAAIVVLAGGGTVAYFTLGGDSPKKATSIMFEGDLTSLDMNLNDTYSLNVVFIPGDAKKEEVVWKSSDERILSVEDGNVTAKKAGNAEIIATTKETMLVATVSILVKKSETPPSTTKPTVPYGRYEGPDNGLDGKITVTKHYKLSLRNANHDFIELAPGDIITRTKFKNGELVGGYWQRGSKKISFHR